MNLSTKNLQVALPLLVVAGLAFVFGRTTATPPPQGETASTIPGHDEEHEHSSEELIEFDEESVRTAGIALAAVSSSSTDAGIPFNGQIEANPRNVVRVSSVVPGRVTRLLVSAGDRVRRGQTLAIVESRSVSEAQSAWLQAEARYRNARSSLQVVLQQARAGVFSRVPLEAARRAHSEAAAEVRMQETAVRQARTAWHNARRLARAGSFGLPAVETARANVAAANEAFRKSEAALQNANASIKAAGAELRRRRELAAGGYYAARPVEEARRAAVNARSARAAAQSEVATAQANFNRAKSLLAEGLVSQRDYEAALQALEGANARFESSRQDTASAESELERQQRLAGTGAAGLAEVRQAEAALAAAEADARTRRAEVRHAEESMKLARATLARESAVFGQGIAERREISTAKAQLESAGHALAKARQELAIAVSALQREERIFKGDLNNIVQVQAARSQAVQAGADLRAARAALSLLKTSPEGPAALPVRAPVSGVVQDPDVAQGEVITADKPLMTIADLSAVHIDFYLPETEAARIWAGASFSATVDALPGRTYNGRIELVHSEVDPKTRMVEAHAEIVNRGELRPGMFARGRITAQGARSAKLTVPYDAVQSVEGRPVVYVPGEKPHSFTAREVTTGETVAGRTVIVSGLKAGERIVVKGAFMVKAQAMKAELGHEH